MQEALIHLVQMMTFGSPPAAVPALYQFPACSEPNSPLQKISCIEDGCTVANPVLASAALPLPLASDAFDAPLRALFRAPLEFSQVPQVLLNWRAAPSSLVSCPRAV